MSAPVIPGYEILEILGRGGMGRVYKATDRRLGRTVAVKTLIDAGDPELVARFEEEAKAIASLSHPNIARLFEFGRTESGIPYCVMEYISGGTLANAIAGRLLGWKQAARLCVTLAHAVHAAHQAGILHRDLKPGNILIDQTKDLAAVVSTASITATTCGVPVYDPTRLDHAPIPIRASPAPSEILPSSLRVADFGLARRLESDSRITKTGQIVGTPAYMAPEQASGVVNRPGPAADVYSLGAILFELLTGRPPFLAADSVEMIMRLLSDDPPSLRSLQPSIPADLQTICLKCLQKKASRRYPSAGELADDLERFLQGRPILARPVSRVERAWKWAARNPWKAIAVSLLVVSTAGATAGLVALRSAYEETVASNRKLQLAVAEANSSFKLSQEALDKIVNRIRDELYEVPQGTKLMLETSRDAVGLHRRLFDLRPDDLSAAQALVGALENLTLSEWVYGSREQSAAATQELELLLNQLRTQHPDDCTIAVAWTRLLLDKVQFPPSTASDEVRAQEQQRLMQAWEHILQAHPEAPEVLKLAAQITQFRMTQAVSEGNIPLYLQEAQHRVDFSRRYFEAEAADKKAEAGMWLVQAMRVLADSLAARHELPRAADIYRQTMTQMQALESLTDRREYRSQTASVCIGLASTLIRQNDVSDGQVFLEKAREILQTLIQDHPEDRVYRTDLTTTLLRLADLLIRQQQSNAALPLLQAAEQQIQSLTNADQSDDSLKPLKEQLESLQALLSTQNPVSSDRGEAADITTKSVP